MGKNSWTFLGVAYSKEEVLGICADVLKERIKNSGDWLDNFKALLLKSKPRANDRLSKASLTEIQITQNSEQLFDNYFSEDMGRTQSYIKDDNLVRIVEDVEKTAQFSYIFDEQMEDFYKNISLEKAGAVKAAKCSTQIHILEKAVEQLKLQFDYISAKQNLEEEEVMEAL